MVVAAIGNLSRIVVSLLGEQHTVERDAVHFDTPVGVLLGQFAAKSVQLAVDRVSRAGVRRRTTASLVSLLQSSRARERDGRLSDVYRCRMSQPLPRQFR